MSGRMRFPGRTGYEAGSMKGTWEGDSSIMLP
jgi:hypothetical protein